MLNFGLMYRREKSSKLLAYTDSDYEKDVDDRNNTSGYVFFLNDAAVCWSSKKQEIVTLSSTKIEYVATTLFTCHCVWVKGVLNILELRTVSALIFFVAMVYQSSSLRIL